MRARGRGDGDGVANEAGDTPTVIAISSSLQLSISEQSKQAVSGVVVPIKSSDLRLRERRREE